MQSHYVTDHYHLQQCYKCQKFGHKVGSEHCKLKDDESKCLYCGRNHRSKDCPVKNEPSKHKCTNCLSSKNPEIRKLGHQHNAASKLCPIYKRELQFMKSITCLNTDLEK